jgi:RNA polymerase sigma-70 factor (ECF subfamily)
LGYSWLQKRWFLVKKGFCRWWNRVVYKLSPVQDDKRKQEGSGTKEDPYQPNPERRYAQREEEDMLKKSIQSLRPALRVVVQLQQLQERSTRETAEAIGITMAATKGRLFHARKALRKSLTPKLLHQPRFTSRIRILPAGQCLGQNECTNTLRPSTSIQSQGRGM